MRVLGKTLAALGVALVFVLTLTLHWPLAALGGFFGSDETLDPQGLAGSLSDGQVARLAFKAQGWPLALGPLTWQLAWPATLALTLGRGPDAWHARGEWRGTSSRWELSGGDMSALDLSRLPLALEARWDGQLTFTLQGTDCIDSAGTLTAASVRLRSPTVVELGQGRLRLDCVGDTPRLVLTLTDEPALSLTLDLDLTSAGGQGRIQGRIDASHPLAEWRQRLNPDASSEHVDQRFDW